MLEFCLETYGWSPEETLGRPWADIVEILEARSRRMERAQRQQKQQDMEAVYTDDLSALGIGGG